MLPNATEPDVKDGKLDDNQEVMIYIHLRPSISNAILDKTYLKNTSYDKDNYHLEYMD